MYIVFAVTEVTAINLVHYHLLQLLSWSVSKTSISLLRTITCVILCYPYYQYA